MRLGRSCEDRERPLSDGCFCKGPHGACVHFEVYETVARFMVGEDEHGDRAVIGEARRASVDAPFDVSGLDPVCREYLRDLMRRDAPSKVPTRERVEDDEEPEEDFDARLERIVAELARKGPKVGTRKIVRCG